MKYQTPFYIALLLLASCTSAGNKQTGTDTLITSDTLANATKTPAAYALCFLRTEGNNKLDTTSIELVVHGNEVSGQMNWLPYQKDSRKGTLTGTIKNDTLKATWSFMQEGMKDTLNLDFYLKDKQLMQKPLKLNTKTGRDQTDESANYTLVYNSDSKIYK
jgi:hypothetical protein